jgi:PBP1b-binding outer membrane lipoprotein LpoB
MHKISLIVLLAGAVLLSGCYTKAYRNAMNQQAQSVKSNTNQVAAQANR